MYIEELSYFDKGKYLVRFENGLNIYLYRSEINELKIENNLDIDDSQYEKILKDILGKRATKRAMHILEKHDKTEKQLRDKLLENNYPEVSIDIAIDYVKFYGYIDDFRYCENYISYRIEKQSKTKILVDLLNKGIDKEIINEVYDKYFEDKYLFNQIQHLLEKKHFFDNSIDKLKKSKIIQSIMRKGYSYNQIQQVINTMDDAQYLVDEIK